jgi:integrase-like protein
MARHARSAGRTCPSLAAKKVHPRTLRHTAAMDLLRRGVDQTVIALWLGHESTATTQIDVHADLQLKERALGRATMTGRPPRRYRPTDRVLAFLEACDHADCDGMRPVGSPEGQLRGHRASDQGGRRLEALDFAFAVFVLAECNVWRAAHIATKVAIRFARVSGSLAVVTR